MMEKITTLLDNMAAPAKLILKYGLLTAVAVFISGFIFYDFCLMFKLTGTYFFKYSAEVMEYSRTLLFQTLFAAFVFNYAFRGD